ncbi:MAG: hypothetical protein AAF202_12665, partial [Pseudomonadota bacterium]
ILLTLAIVVGCGGNSPFDRNQDPLKDYPSFKDDSSEQTAPPAEVESVEQPTQEFLEDNFKLTVKGKNPDEPFTFIRGQANEYEIVVRNLVPDTVFAYEIVQNIDGSANQNEGCNDNLPCLDLEGIEGDTQTYRLKWTPSMSFEIDEPEFPGRIEMDFIYKDGTSQAARERHDLILTTREFAAMVVHKNEPAFIQGSTQLDGESVEFSESEGKVNVDIRIVDPNAFSARKPEVQFVGSMAGVDFLAIGFFNPVMAEPELRDGVWVQRFELNVAGLAAAYRASNSNASGQFKAGFALRANSTATRKSSPQKWERSFTVKLSEGGE